MLKTPINIHPLFNSTAGGGYNLVVRKLKKNKKYEKKYSDIDVVYNRIFLLRAKQYRFCLYRNDGFGKI